MSARGLWGGPRRVVAVLFMIAGGVLLVPAARADPPTLSGTPTNMAVEATSASGATVTWTDPSAADDNGAGTGVPGPVPVSCSPAAGSMFPLGPTTVTCSGTDPFDSSVGSTSF